MELRDRTVMILGGSGLVGQAVARRVLAASPRRVVLVALFEEEVQAAAASLEPHRGRAAIAVEWGDVFLPAALAKLGRGTVVASAEHRAVLLHDLLSELTEEALGRSFLAQLLMKYRPDAVVDSINTATAFAYQDVVQAARELLERAAQGTADRAAVEQLTLVIALRSEEHTSELQSRLHLVCRLLLEKKKHKTRTQKKMNSSMHEMRSCV